MIERNDHAHRGLLIVLVSLVEGSSGAKRTSIDTTTERWTQLREHTYQKTCEWYYLNEIYLIHRGHHSLVLSIAHAPCLLAIECL